MLCPGDINEMTDLPFNWQLQRTNNRHQKKNRFISSLKIDLEWSLVCLWSQNHNPYTPEYLEVCRNSKDKEIMVSGTVKLKRNSECLLQRKFSQLIEAGCTTTQLELEYIKQSSYYDYPQYYLTGTLRIPASETEKEYSKRAEFESLQNLSNDFECLLDPKANYFSDVNLKCKAESFAAHKSILSTRSPVFATMFTTKMRENQDNKVVIEDISPRILKIMLIYLYTGKTGELCFQTAGELLFAADKYQLQDLKRVCIGYLKSCVSSQNVLNTLVLGYLHAQNLKDFALEFICNSSEEFEVMEKTVEWKSLREIRPALAMDLLTSLVKSKDKKLKLK